MENFQEYILGKLGETFTGLSGKTKDDFGAGKLYIPYTNIFENAQVDISKLEFVRIGLERQNKVRYGDLFFTTSSETVEEVGLTSVLLDELEEAYLNSFCFGFRLRTFELLRPEYASFLFRSHDIRKQITRLGQGSTRINLPKTELLEKLLVTFPEKDEQAKIFEILSKIDESISTTQKLITKYERIKTGLMQDLLTKGIDENGQIRSEVTHEFKDSELGRIPVEWDIAVLGDSTIDPICYGIVQVGENTSGGVPTIAIRDLLTNFELVHLTNKDIEDKYPRSRVIGGELLISIKATTGRVDVVPSSFNGNISRDIAKIRFKKEYSPNFYKSYFHSELGQRSLDLITVGTTRKEISIAPLKKVLIPFVPFKEQTEIVKQVKSVDLLIKQTNKELNKLGKLKQGLMQDLLTGKVRVTRLLEETATTT